MRHLTKLLAGCICLAVAVSGYNVPLDMKGKNCAKVDKELERLESMFVNLQAQLRKVIVRVRNCKEDNNCVSSPGRDDPPEIGKRNNDSQIKLEPPERPETFIIADSDSMSVERTTSMRLENIHDMLNERVVNGPEINGSREAKRRPKPTKSAKSNRSNRKPQNRAANIGKFQIDVTPANSRLIGFKASGTLKSPSEDPESLGRFNTSKEYFVTRKPDSNFDKPQMEVPPDENSKSSPKSKLFKVKTVLDRRVNKRVESEASSDSSDSQKDDEPPERKTEKQITDTDQKDDLSSLGFNRKRKWKQNRPSKRLKELERSFEPGSEQTVKPNDSINQSDEFGSWRKKRKKSESAQQYGESEPKSKWKKQAFKDRRRKKDRKRKEESKNDST